MLRVAGPAVALFSGRALFFLPQRGLGPRIGRRSSLRTARGTGVVVGCLHPPSHHTLTGCPISGPSFPPSD
ncbi:hypothetical protein NDU88_003885 [Pleurodeles waltl]|uniref:Secreted protein n=1 Tax=Pleurodeles waltl TaxID=8319 RepID=A0AAV7UFM2_PLEWA|nr:hypothetical protein NDU88_003885 [Pleurodeles waltl]